MLNIKFTNEKSPPPPTSEQCIEGEVKKHPLLIDIDAIEMHVCIPYNLLVVQAKPTGKWGLY